MNERTDAPADVGMAIDLTDGALLDERLRGIDTSVESLRDHIGRNDAEIDALQAALTPEKVPWYRRPSTWSAAVAIGALVLSVGTTWLSSSRLATEDVRAARSEVRLLLQRLSAVQVEEVEAFATQDQVTAGLLSNLFGVEQRLLARQALEVMQRIPEHVTSNEFWIVGNTLMLVDQYAEADQAFERSHEIASGIADPFDIIQALIGRAQTAFLAQRVDDGRQFFTEALAVHETVPPESAYLIPFTAAQVELFWAGSEHLAGNCDQVAVHVASSQSAIDQTLDALRPSLQQGVDSVSTTACVQS